MPVGRECDRSIMWPVLWDQLYVCQNIDLLPKGDWNRQFVPNEAIKYHNFCDDFGPMNLASVTRFIVQLDSELDIESPPILFYCVDTGRRAMTNALFLLGAYMILRLKNSVDAVLDTFRWADDDFVESFRDATHGEPDFGLTLEDCWRGLARGVKLGWIAVPSSAHTSYRWGVVDIQEYENYDEPLNGDLHEVVPGKFIAFKGPVELPGVLYQDDEDGYRSFSPQFYADIFSDFAVKAVVRLCEPRYDAECFEESGARLYDLEFEDCTAPPDSVVEEFMEIADETDGMVAVHCKAGLGRTGTLIGVYLMRRHGFTGREAIGWLRIMRPGSVIGEQQQFLCSADPSSFRSSSSGWGSSRRLSVTFAKEVAAGVEQRALRRASGAASAEPPSPPA